MLILIKCVIILCVDYIINYLDYVLINEAADAIRLPYLLQVWKLEEAVELIIRSSQFFTTHEWEKYVGCPVG